MTTELAFYRLCTDNVHLLENSDIFDNPVDPEQLAAFVADEGHELFFAICDTKIVGFASGTILLHPDKQPAFLVNEVDVAPQFQRQGIATALCERLLGIARRIGCKGFWLATEEDNEAARALYRGLKARETKGIVVYDWDGALDV